MQQPDLIDHKFADFLASFRKVHRLTIQKLAERSGINPSTLRKYEKVKSRPLPLQLCQLICDGMGYNEKVYFYWNAKLNGTGKKNG